MSRTPRVTPVDITARTATGRRGGQDVQITIQGKLIRFYSSGNLPVQLTYAVPAMLEGTTADGSRATPATVIVMQRQM